MGDQPVYCVMEMDICLTVFCILILPFANLLSDYTQILRVFEVCIWRW